MTNYGLVRVVLNTEIVSEPVPVKVVTTETIHELDGKIRYYLIRDARDGAIGVTISGKPMCFLTILDTKKSRKLSTTPI